MAAAVMMKSKITPLKRFCNALSGNETYATTDAMMTVLAEFDGTAVSVTL